ncbi:TetR/AcrR family transcriptional regulator [Streptacidiphilus rugosus]|uniref:TetR/AcrR family transcriptional regulator n=1 Tax=Streptacidiphilus rugosus TaxID=405783 RepID=UPI000568641E|nr:TetR/AcrR family transcriptional regulator [Streptacidiphilus rugosus]
MARAGLTAERVTRAAADLADEVGLERVTVAALARSFGVADASLYSHVRNLAALREQVAAFAAGEFASLLEEAVAGRAGRDALFAFGDAYRRFALAHPGRYAATQLPVPSEGGTRIVEACAALFRGYDLEPVAAIDAARLLRSTFHGWAVFESSWGFRAERPVEESWQAALGALDGALRAWGSPGA